jgi:signal transduction histidine kinase
MRKNMVQLLQSFWKRLRDLQKAFARSFSERIYPETFFEEINEQCRIFFVPYSPVFFVVWLPYLHLDSLLFPDEPLIIALRLGLTAVGILAWCARYWWKHPQRHYIIVNVMIYYLIIATGIITGLAKGHPSYIGGYCFVIIVISAMPLRLLHLYTALAISLAIFVLMCWNYHVSFAEPTLQYSLQDLMGAVVVNMVLSSGWLVLRRNSYQKGRTLQELNNRFSQQQESLERQNQALERATNLLEQANIFLGTANQELEERNEMLNLLNLEKTELMAIVSHDLKNPITVVSGLAEILRDETLSPERKSMVLDQLALVGSRMLELVKNLLDMNHLESGLMKFNNYAFDIAPLLEATMNQYRSPAAAKNLTIHYDKTSSQSVVVADEQAMMQVLDNIVSNAVKYSPAGKNIFVRLRSDSEKVRIEIEDEGEGVSSTDMKRLFGKFARLSARPTAGEHSTGLGLSIVKKLVEAMHGRVWCESELGKGATFIVELPQASQKSSNA